MSFSNLNPVMLNPALDIVEDLPPPFNGKSSDLDSFFKKLTLVFCLAPAK
jgi:hypothetical protein